MDGTAVKEIKRIVEDSARIVEVDGVNYTNGNFHILRHKDRAETLGFNNLSSLVPILKNEIGRDDFKKPLYIIVADHRDVVVVTSLDDDLDRDRLYGVMTEESDFRFGRYYGYEEFVIALRSKFTDTGDRESLLEYLKKISDVRCSGRRDFGRRRFTECYYIIIGERRLVCSPDPETGAVPHIHRG